MFTTSIICMIVIAIQLSVLGCIVGYHSIRETWLFLSYRLSHQDKWENLFEVVVSLVTIIISALFLIGAYIVFPLQFIVKIGTVI